MGTSIYYSGKAARAMNIPITPSMLAAIIGLQESRSKGAMAEKGVA
ncbi:MAG: hypothetical protein H8D43_01955 [Chloroflexi bacterium]|nr:hypothetical protein [Chloroflexota bacterium]